MIEGMGHGVNQRALIHMTPEEVDAFLIESRTMTMCSLGPDGSIHAVAMWYGFLEGCVAVETKAKSQKVQNLRRDPRLTLLFEAGESYDELRGVELVGRAEMVDDPERFWTLGVSVYERYVRPLPTTSATRSRPCSTSAWPSRCTRSARSVGTTANCGLRRYCPAVILPG
jgi:PPOX class probable F420-dependent enzyme